LTETPLLATEVETQENEPLSTHVTVANKNNKERPPSTANGLEIQEGHCTTSDAILLAMSDVHLTADTQPGQAFDPITSMGNSPLSTTVAVQQQQHKNHIMGVVDSSVVQAAQMSTNDNRCHG